MLSLVDNRAFIRLSFRVLEHDPTQNDIRRFLADFKARLDVRGLAVRGVATDGSELYPEPLKELWPDVPHQVCEFHVIKEITKAVLHALVATRKKLRDRIPKQPRGRPRKAERAQSRKATRQQQQVSKLFEHRYLFVQHRLTADQKTTLQRITRGLAHLRRLRQIMEEVYRLFDRRCRTETALARLAQLRGRVSRCKRLGRALDKLSSPNLEKALTFLDDKLLPATSNAVERSNRRYRKAQKSIYSVRTAEHIRQRIALDMQREGAIRKNRCLGTGFLFSHTPANNRRFPTLPSQGERPCPSANPANGDIQRRPHSNRGIASRRSGPRSRTSSSRSKPNAAMGA